MLQIKQWKHHHHYIYLRFAPLTKIHFLSHSTKTILLKMHSSSTHPQFPIVLFSVCVVLCSIIRFPVILNMLSDLRCLIFVLSFTSSSFVSGEKKGSWRVRKGRPLSAALQTCVFRFPVAVQIKRAFFLRCETLVR